MKPIIPKSNKQHLAKLLQRSNTSKLDTVTFNANMDEKQSKQLQQHVSNLISKKARSSKPFHVVVIEE